MAWVSSSFICWWSAQFRSYGVPLIIMAPIPLTLIGIMPGHALLGQQFTAPSMIGMIALAGIIVRNSILLVDFVEQEVRAGKPLQDATISAAAVRARPIALTAAAAMLGGFFILDDPIFSGLAVSLIFGLFVSTVLTLLVIPVVYYHYHWLEAIALAKATPGLQPVGAACSRDRSHLLWERLAAAIAVTCCGSGLQPRRDRRSRSRLKIAPTG
jgi:predicted RND superfamily exporter protein